MAPIIISARGILLASLVVGGLAALVITNNTKEKSEYDLTTGVIQYLEKNISILPLRHKGDYRYLKISSYPYPFEIYEPNSLETSETIDDLKYSDTIDVYYYETSNTHTEVINRYVQFIDHNNNPHFIRSGFQKQLGYILVGLALLLNVMGFIFWKMGKLDW